MRSTGSPPVVPDPAGSPAGTANPPGGRALRYVRELRRRGLLLETLRSLREDLRGFGAGDPLRYALRLAGVETYLRLRYPVGGRALRVRATPYWKYWRNLEAGAHDLENLRFLASVVRPGETVLDVGAWEGPYTLLLADLVGEAGAVHAFEPDPRALAALRDNVAANGLRNVTPVGLCASDAEGTADFYDAGGGTVGTIVRNDAAAGFPRVPVRTTTIDAYSRERGLAVSGLKVDVEGAEGLVLAGARDVIARCSPWLFLEFHGMFMPEEARAATWAAIAGDARSVTFVRGESRRYRPGDPLEGYPDTDYFHAFLRY